MVNQHLKLYNYFRSSASYRARIALHFKELEFEYIPVHIVNGEQNSTAYRDLNPMGHVPALVHGGFVIAETIAIFDYLDHLAPSKLLLPAEPRRRARVLQICEIINSGIQPYQNLKVLKDFETVSQWNREQREKWVRHWVESGMANLERLLEATAGLFACGDEVTAADAFLVPQCFSARRFGVESSRYPIIHRVSERAAQLPAFVKSHPASQPDIAP